MCFLSPRSAPFGAILWLLLLTPSAPGQTEKPGASSGRGANQERSLEVGNVKRSYLLHLPQGYVSGQPVPLVIALHGLGGTGRIMAMLTGFSDLADKKGFAVAYPDGFQLMWRYAKDDDVNFIRALIDQLEKEKAVDARRVYVTGISNGAYFSSRLAGDLGDRIAAVATVAGTMTRLQGLRAKLPRPIPLLHIHGCDDAIVSYDGKDKFSKRHLSWGAEEFVRWWAEHNGCEQQPVVEKLPDQATDGTSVERHLFRPGRARAEVVLYKIQGGGHTWPDGSWQPELLLGKTCRDFNASAVIWDFFVRSQLPKEKK